SGEINDRSRIRRPSSKRQTPCARALGVSRLSRGFARACALFVSRRSRERARLPSEICPRRTRRPFPPPALSLSLVHNPLALSATSTGLSLAHVAQTLPTGNGNAMVVLQIAGVAQHGIAVARDGAPPSELDLAIQGEAAEIAAFLQSHGINATKTAAEGMIR